MFVASVSCFLCLFRLLFVNAFLLPRTIHRPIPSLRRIPNIPLRTFSIRSSRSSHRQEEEEEEEEAQQPTTTTTTKQESTTTTTTTTLPQRLTRRNTVNPNTFSKRARSIQWIIQSIQRYGYNTTTNQHNPNNTNPVTRKNPYEKFEDRASKSLLQIISKLQQANSQRELIAIGRELESLNISETESIPIIERVIKVTALSGLHSLSLQLLNSLLDKGYLPSSMAYDSVCISLRKAGKFTVLEELLEKLKSVAATQQQQPLTNTTTNVTTTTIAATSTMTPSISIISFNTYLAALCDIATGKDNYYYYHRNIEALENAWQLLHPQIAQRVWGVTPDETSYNTVLHAAACLGQRTLANEIWKEMNLRNRIPPSIISYNARLRSIVSISGAYTVENDKLAFSIWEEIIHNPSLQPNQYTMDSMLLPFIRAGRIEELEETYIHSFVVSHSRKVVSDAFAAFFSTMVKGGELRSARAMFDKFVLPSLSPVVNGFDEVSRLVHPTVRHFNILLEGYRQLAESTTTVSSSLSLLLSSSSTPTTKTTSSRRDGSSSSSKEETYEDYDTTFETESSSTFSSSSSRDKKKKSNNNNNKKKDSQTFAVQENDPLQKDRNARLNARLKAEGLFEIMRNAGLAPDEYTLTTMMGIYTTSTDISNLLFNYVTTADNNRNTVRPPVSTTTKGLRQTRYTTTKDPNTNRNHKKILVTPAVLRAAMTAYGRVGDPSSACYIFDKFNCSSMNTRTWNVLMHALAKGAQWCLREEDTTEQYVLSIPSSVAAKVLEEGQTATTTQQQQAEEEEISASSSATSDSRNNSSSVKKPFIKLFDLIEGQTCPEAAKTLLNIMGQQNREKLGGNSSRNALPSDDKVPKDGPTTTSRAQRLLLPHVPPANSQTYCIAASTIHYGETGAPLAREIFRNATNSGIPADGRFVNAVFHCFGDDIEAALFSWKDEIRREVLDHEYRTRAAPPSIHRKTNKNLIAAYNGLMFVCGRALRPDIAVRLAYAMNKEGIEPSEVSLNSYNSGKQMRSKLLGNNADEKTSIRKKLLQLINPYESILAIECTKYDVKDKRREGEKRIRIIV